MKFLKAAIVLVTMYPPAFFANAAGGGVGGVGGVGGKGSKGSKGGGKGKGDCSSAPSSSMVPSEAPSDLTSVSLSPSRSPAFCNPLSLDCDRPTNNGPPVPNATPNTSTTPNPTGNQPIPVPDGWVREIGGGQKFPQPSDIGGGSFVLAT